MRFDTVIRNGTVVTATDTSLADVGIAGDKVTAIAAQLPAENATRIVDASGCLVIPGGIDAHTPGIAPAVAVAPEACVRERLEEGHGNVKRAFFRRAVKLATLTRRELYNFYGVFDVAGDLDVESDAGFSQQKLSSARSLESE